jgi:predicted helicase
VYLTNSLEEGERDSRDLFMAQWLTREAREANTIKRQTPIMCVLGNPPYAGESANKGDWIMGLMDTYKKEPGGQQKLQERNPKWINDDYVKFMRLAEHTIAKNGEGVLGFITNHGWLDNPTFRGMRWHLLNTFDKLWVLDLHGNSKKREVAPDGSADKNVFDIQQGVAIVIGVKKKQANAKAPKPLAQVQHAELWGDRAGKYLALQSLGLQNRDGEKPLWQPLVPQTPQLVLVPRDTQLLAEYQAGFSLQAFMPVSSVGIVTARDGLTIDMDKQVLWQRIQDFAQLAPEAARAKYALGNDVRDWTVAAAQADVTQHLAPERLLPIAYRPFDNRWTFYTGNSRGVLCYPRGQVMRHMNDAGALGLATARSNKNPSCDHFFVTNSISEAKFAESSTQSSLFPLYLYPSEQDLDQTRRVNFDSTLYARLQTLAADPQRGMPDEVAVFDYLYGTLHRPSYRQRYAPFLKTDFPRIPWPTSPAAFWATADAGRELRCLHLMEPQAVGAAPFPFLGEGSGVLDKPWRDEAGKVWINATQGFDGVPLVAWNFWIGGYQPAQKWLKDRRGRTLGFDDVKHYQRVIKVLTETDRIMQTLG